MTKGCIRDERKRRLGKRDGDLYIPMFGTQGV